MKSLRGEAVQFDGRIITKQGQNTGLSPGDRFWTFLESHREKKKRTFLHIARSCFVHLYTYLQKVLNAVLVTAEQTQFLEARTRHFPTTSAFCPCISHVSTGDV